MAESALLAGLLKAPSRYSPIYNPAKAVMRAKVALQAMEKEGYITHAEKKEALLFPAQIKHNL